MLALDMRAHTLAVQIDQIVDELRKFEIPPRSSILALCDMARGNAQCLHAALDPSA